MEKYRTVIEGALDLTDTMGEGIDYIRQQIGFGGFLDTLHMFNEILSACAAIETHLQLFAEKLPDNHLEEFIEKLRISFASLALAYEQGNSERRVLQVIQSMVSPAYESWREELHRTLSPYTTL